MATLKIKKGDNVRVIAGKDKDREGKVLAVDAKKNTVVVEGINMITKHAKPSMANQQGGIINREAPIDISNVMLLHKGEPTRVGFTVEEVDGKKIKHRIAKKSGEQID
ncbi:MAG: 50S ribosomal protein L24 [Lachnospiraceae bacterium]|nr:50S ribosomal protein L24 [Candidatus Equihabitans merdae]